MEQNDSKENLKDLEMAKKRNHKIMITDEAIKKVPRIKYKNILGSYYLMKRSTQVTKPEI